MLLGLVAEAGLRRSSTSASCATTRPRWRRCSARRRPTCDAIVTSGGVSMGDYDVVKAVLSRIAEMRWMQIAIKPAKPFAFGLLDGGTPVFGLPGNPVSSMVSFELFARPALRTMMGHPGSTGRASSAVADDGLPPPPDGKTHFMRVDGGVRRRRPGARRARSAPGQPPAGRHRHWPTRWSSARRRRRPPAARSTS